MAIVCCLLLAFVEVDMDNAEHETKGCCGDCKKLLSTVLAPRCIVRFGTPKALTKTPVDADLPDDVIIRRIEEAVVAKK